MIFSTHKLEQPIFQWGIKIYEKRCLIIVVIGLVIFAVGGLMTCVGGKAIVEATKESPAPFDF